MRLWNLQCWQEEELCYDSILCQLRRSWGQFNYHTFQLRSLSWLIWLPRRRALSSSEIQPCYVLTAQFNWLVGCTWCLVQWCELFNTAQLNWLVVLVLGWYNELINSEQVGWQVQYCSVQPWVGGPSTWYLVQYFSSNQLLNTAQFNCLVGCPSTTYLIQWYAKFSKL